MLARLHRRAFLLAGTATTASFARAVRAQGEQLTLSGAIAQGGLVIGRAARAANATLDDRKLPIGPGGSFVFGFRHDQKKEVTLTVRYTDGTSESRKLSPEQRQYDIQRIDGLPQEQVTPSPKILARIKRESETNAEHMRRVSDFAGYASGFDWPVPGIISSVYGSQRILNGTPMSPHLGVDVAAPKGTPIRAPADARVSLVADEYLNGGFTILDHGHGLFTSYVHQINIRVREGDWLKKGQIMSEVGATGRATGPNLHWGMSWMGISLDASLATLEPQPPKT